MPTQRKHRSARWLGRALAMTLILALAAFALGCRDVEQPGIAPALEPPAEASATTPAEEAPPTAGEPAATATGLLQNAPPDTPGAPQAEEPKTPGKVEPATEDPPTPEEVLRQAAEAMAALQSARLRVEITVNTTVPQPDAVNPPVEFHPGMEFPLAVPVQVTMDGEYQMPDRSRFRTSMEILGITVTNETIQVGDQTYIREASSDQWWTLEDGHANLSRDVAALSGLVNNLANSLHDPALAPTELDGEVVYHVAGAARQPLFQELLEQKGGTVGAARIEYWIGAQDHLVRQTELTVASASGPEDQPESMTSLQARVTFFEYNNPVDIRAPEMRSASPGPQQDQHGDSRETATPFRPGTFLSGNIGSPADADFFTFQAKGDTTYRITLKRTTPMQVQLALLDGDGKLLVQGQDDDYPYTRIAWTDPTPGQHYLQVSGREQNMGSYTILVTEDPVDSPSLETTSLQPGQQVTGEMTEDRREHLYSFQVKKENGYRITLPSLGQLSLSLEVIAPPGEVVTSTKTLPGRQATLTWGKDTPGEHLLRVTSRGGGPGSYTLTLSEDQGPYRPDGNAPPGGRPP